MKRTLTLIVLMALSFPSHAQETGILHLIPLHLELPADWDFDGSSNPIQGRNPNGEILLITIVRQREDGTPRDSAQSILDSVLIDFMQSFVKQKKYTVVRDLTPIPVPEGKAGVSLIAKVNNRKFFNQYSLASEGVGFYISHEGPGEAIEAAKQFDKYLTKQTWD